MWGFVHTYSSGLVLHGYLTIHPDMHTNFTPVRPPKLSWDIFCQVIDNYGDIGVCWRLCADLAQRGHLVRLWVDDASALRWMAPGALSGTTPNITVHDWTTASQSDRLNAMTMADVWIEAFGCRIPDDFVQYWVKQVQADTPQRKPPHWINLEYLSAESYVEHSHGLQSPVMQGPAKGWIKHFYYPGFSHKTGGLLREPELSAKRQHFDRNRWLGNLGIEFGEIQETIISLFCYEPPALKDYLTHLQDGPQRTRLLVTAGRSTSWVLTCLKAQATPKWPEPIQAQLTALERTPTAEPRHISLGALTLSFLPSLTQTDFDHLLWSCDFNLVRGEDSLVRAIWAGVPFLWQIYEQEDLVHAEKLNAYLRMTQAPSSLANAHLWWNNLDMSLSQGEASEGHRLLTHYAAGERWKNWIQTFLERMQSQEDLVTGLLRFILKTSKMKGFAE